MLKSLRFPRISRKMAFAVGLVGCAATVLAQGGGGPPTMPTIELPVDEASVITTVTAAAIGLLLLIFGMTIGFLFVKKLFRRVGKVV